MGKITGFKEFDRVDEGYINVAERVQNYKEFTQPLEEMELRNQGARCMNCGVPFCHSGCPLGNLIPDFNDEVYKGNWESALKILHKTNNFPEFTGRLCPAPCEEACVLGINEDPVSIENIEKNIVETAFENNWISAKIPAQRTGKKVAVIGSGPSGLAAAQQLNYAGHSVTVFERDDKVGGLLRYGIPDFKLEKSIIDRRIKVLEEEGIKFKTNSEVGKSVSIQELNDFDAILLAIGSTIRRGLNIPGSDLDGVVQAMDFLKQNNKRVNGGYNFEKEILATDKNVIVIGGGDTGSDCIGTSNRHKAKSVTNFEILDKPTKNRPINQPWPYFPTRLKTTTSHKEGVERYWNISTKECIGENGKLKAIKTVEVEWKKDSTGRYNLIEKPNSEKIWECELVLLAMGFTGPEKSIAEQFGLELDDRGNIKANENSYQTSLKNIFAAGDSRRGQSLIVWAISEGREAAHHIDKFLMGKSHLPTKGYGDLPRV